MLPENPGRDPVRVNDGIVGREIDKKRITSCNEMYRGSRFASTRKGADPIVTVSHCMKGGYVFSGDKKNHEISRD